MPITINVSNDLRNLLNVANNKNLVSQVRQNFSQTGPTTIKRAILKDMIIGISPVKGVGKWVKYSDSYKDVIKGVAAFRKVGNRTFAIRSDDAGLSSKARRGRRDKISDLNAEFIANQSPKKQISPVNLRLSGELHKAIKAYTRGGFGNNFRLVVEIEHFLADIHNKQGAGKSKVVRRILPTESGEEFNREITQAIIDELKKSVEKIAKKFSGQ